MTNSEEFKRELSNHSDLLSELTMRVTLFNAIDHDKSAVTAIIETAGELLASFNRMTAIMRSEGN